MANDVRTIILPTDAEDPSTVLSSLFSEASGSIGGMVRDDGETFAIILADASTSGLRSYDARAIPDGTTAILAIGLPDRPPSGGTFLLSYDGVSTNTAAIPANPTAAELQTALNANPSRFAAGPVTVLKEGADYRITDTNPGVRSLLGANGTFLIPLSSSTVRQYRAGTDDGEREIQILSLRQSPYAAQTAFDPLPAAGYTLSTVAAGTTDTPAVQLLTLDPAPYGGTFTVDSKIIPFDASEQTFANAYGGGVSVSKAGDFAWQFTQGANGALVSTVSIAKLLVPKGFLITLNLSTFEFLFAFSQLDAGADSFLAYLSFQVTFPGKLPKTYLRRLVEIFRSVINADNLVSVSIGIGYPAAADVLTKSGNLAGLADVAEARANLEIAFEEQSNNSISIGTGAGVTNPATPGGNIHIGSGAGTAADQSDSQAATTIAIGFDAGAANRYGYHNVFIGDHAGAANVGEATVAPAVSLPGSGNTYVGAEAGSNATLPSHGTFLGDHAGINVTTGVENTIIGAAAASSGNGTTYLLTGHNNTLLGYAAGFQVTSGSQNLLLGSGVGTVLHTGGDNVLLGTLDQTLTTGSRNIVVGISASIPSASTSDFLNLGNVLYGNLSNGRIGIGVPSPTQTLDLLGSINFTGSLLHNGSTVGVFTFYDASLDNYAAGRNAGNGTITGVGNVALGYNAGHGLTSGGENVALGYNAGSAVTTGGANILLGWNAGQGLTTQSGNTIVGSTAGASASNSAAGNSFYGQNAGFANTTGSTNTLLGNSSGVLNTTGGGLVAVGDHSGGANTTGANNTFLGKDAGGSSTATISNATAIGYNAQVTASNSLVLGNGANVGIGTTAPTEKLDLVGNVKVSGTMTAGGKAYAAGLTVGGVDDPGDGLIVVNAATVYGLIHGFSDGFIEGKLTVGGVFKPGSCLVSTVPSAAANSGGYIDVTDAAAGAGLYRSNGTNWLRVGDANTVLS